MYMSPSNILYTNCVDQEFLHDISIEKNILEASRTFIKRGTYPSLQAVKKGGYYFTLNDMKLRLYRHLETTGQCGMVRIRKVSPREVPEGIRQLMKPPDRPPPGANKDGGPRSLSRKYYNIDAGNAKPPRLLQDTDDDSDDEDTDDTDDDTDACSNSDWSYDEPSGTEVVSADEKNDEDEVDESKNDEETSFI